MGTQENNEIKARISQACKDMKSAYATLANDAEPAANALEGGITRLKQWKVKVNRTVSLVPGSTVPHDPSVEYWDTEPTWWHRTFGGVVEASQVPHPRAGEAREEAKKLFGEAITNDEDYDLDAKDIGGTIDGVCAMMTTWLDVAGRFSSNVAQKIPSDPSFVPTSGGMNGWLSPSAANGYAASFRSQNSAAATTSRIISDLMDNCATFLNSLNNNLTNFAALTLAQEEFYTDLITGISLPSDITFDAVMGLIATGIKAVQTHRKNQDAEATTMGTMLNGSIQATLDLAELDRQITEMGETGSDGGWPQPAPMDVGLTSYKQSTEDTLLYNTQYFKDHAQFWRDISAEIAPLKTIADGVSDIPVMFARIPAFSANQSTGLNELSDRLATDALGKGVTATSAMADKLDATIREYLLQEAENAEVANSIYRQIYGEDMPS